MYTESYELELKKLEVERDGLALKQRQLILKKDEIAHQVSKFDVQIDILTEQLTEIGKMITWTQGQITQGKIRPHG